jgi:DNA helicase-2/ATP-dependent DNA helicase PcrA
LVAARKPGSKPALVACGDAHEQAAFVAQRALELRDEGVSLNDMAVLYRSHFHALELQLELTRRNIPFSITSGIRFFEQAHVKDVVAYLKFACNPRDEIAFKRIVRMLPGIGGKSADKLWANFAKRLESSLPLPAENTATKAPPRLAALLQECASQVPKKAEVEWTELTISLDQLEQPPVMGHPSEMITHVIDAGYEDYVMETFPNYRARLEDLEQLASFALQFKNTDEFLSQLALLSNLEADDERPSKSDSTRPKASNLASSF